MISVKKQTEYLVFFLKEGEEYNNPSDFCLDKYDFTARVTAPDVRYVPFCVRDTDKTWTENPNVRPFLLGKLRNISKFDVISDVDASKIYLVVSPISGALQLIRP